MQELLGGSPTVNFLTGLAVDEFFTRTDATTTRHYLADAIGSSVALTDSTGAVQTEYTYDPFGNRATTGATTSNTITFSSRELDASSLYYYRARYYDAHLQRFLNEDPSGFAGGRNLFAYVDNMPTRATDPFGLKPCQWVSWFEPCGPNRPPKAQAGAGSGGGAGGGAGSGAGNGPGGPGQPGDGNPKPDEKKPDCSGPSPGTRAAFGGYAMNEGMGIAGAGGAVMYASGLATATLAGAGPVGWPLIPAATIPVFMGGGAMVGGGLWEMWHGAHEVADAWQAHQACR